jgi:hypothetical protein
MGRGERFTLGQHKARVQKKQHVDARRRCWGMLAIRPSLPSQMTQENGNCPNSATSAIHAVSWAQGLCVDPYESVPPVPCRQPTFTRDGSRLIFADSSLKTDNLVFQATQVIGAGAGGI